MAQYSSFVFFCGSFILSSIVIPLLCDAGGDVDDRETYIVYMGSLPKESSYSPTSHHLSMLQQVTNEIDAASSLIRSYKRSFNGFAAKLTKEQSEKIAQMEEVVSVFPSTTLHTQTTRSWDFMGFVEPIKRNISGESEVIIGHIDTGIWPESESFRDEGLGPPPKKWKGTCAGGKNFTCNHKIIGARFYEEESAMDYSGHGTHTASIAVGSKVNDTSFYGLAEGTARGGVPSARIAIYKACTREGGCSSATILVAFDDAIADGVDILSLSIAFFFPEDLYKEAVAIGSFHAMARGILTVQSAGNNGPDSGSIPSVAPWVLSVAASTTDRQIIDKVVLGNGRTIVGDSVNAFESKGTKFPIAKCGNLGFEVCDCLRSEVKGKIVLCVHHDEKQAEEAGAVGAIVRDSGEGFIPQVTLSPSLTISSNDYDVVESYSRSAHPEAEISKSESIVNNTAPRVAKFSARGPNLIIPEILKPDITAPGIYILAAFSPTAPPSVFSSGAESPDTRRVKYNIVSGTSLSCPHVSGIAAYVKSFHPDWSPAAIKSAIMTTAKLMNGTEDHQIGEFGYGSGHVNPVQAIDPGLVYDLSKEDYLEILCNIGYNTTLIKQISGDPNITCPKSPDRSLISDTNYPSLVIEVQPMQPFNVKINRIATNVGFANSNYKVSVFSRPGLNITVEPQVLSFKSLNEKQSFVVTIAGGKFPNSTTLSSSLVWSDGTHNVRSPIIVNVLKSN